MPTNNGDITFKYGSQNAYNALTTTDTNAVYVTTDTHRIYIDGVDYTADTEMNNATKQYVDGQVGIIGERVDNIIAHNNDTEGNTELIDLRNTIHGVTFSSAGTAVRQQLQKHEDLLNDFADYNYTSSTATVSHDNIYQGTIIKSDGTLQSNEYTARFVVKKYENVSKGKYKAHGFPQNNNCLYVIVSSDDTVIEYQKIGDTIPADTRDYDFYVLYDGCTVYVGGYDTVLPMLYKYDQTLGLNEEVYIPQIENNQNTLNPLYQKIVTLNGDSIAYGAGCTVDGQSWGFMDFIAERNNMTLDKQAVNGGCLSVKSTDSAGRHYICRTVENMNENADYVIFEGGYNDWYLWHRVGSITETMTDEVDDNTVYGALESICRQSLERWHTAKIGFIITHKINTAWRTVHDNSSTEHVTLEDYYQAIRDVCEKYSIPYFDLSKVSRLNTELQSYKSFTYNSDGIHPTQQGYETFYVAVIENWLKNL